MDLLGGQTPISQERFEVPTLHRAVGNIPREGGNAQVITGSGKQGRQIVGIQRAIHLNRLIRAVSPCKLPTVITLNRAVDQSNVLTQIAGDGRECRFSRDTRGSPPPPKG